MHENESIHDIIMRFMKITNGFSSLGDSINNGQNVRKVIQALYQSWEIKSTTLKELNEKKEVERKGRSGLHAANQKFDDPLDGETS